MAVNLGTGFGKVTVRPDMNVTPLVDVVLVLLIIFMVLAPVMTEAFNVRLPPKDDKDEQLDDANDPNQPLVVSVAEDGTVEVNSVVIETSELSERLHRMFNARPDNLLYLDGADEAAYGSVLTVLDLARHGGATPVVLITKKLEAK
jgi:biopolymer transport protein ExbD/biopolymer transport protein TolR